MTKEINVFNIHLLYKIVNVDKHAHTMHIEYLPVQFVKLLEPIDFVVLFPGQAMQKSCPVWCW